MKIHIGRWFIGFQWKKDNSGREYKYIYPFNYLSREVRYWGYLDGYYDGPKPSWGFWFFNVSWQFED